MDTPNRNHQQQPQQPQSGTPRRSQCQDSPVFIYLKNLSPIKPVESVHLAHSLSFPAIPSVFKSPHINIRKESKPLSRYPLSDLSKSEFFCQDGDERNLCMGVSNVVKLSDHIGRTQEDDILMYTLDEPTVIPPEECSTLPTKQPESFQYDSGSPNHNNSLSYHMKSDFVTGSTSMMEIVHDDLQGNNQFSHMPELGGVQQNEELREVQICDWKNLISDDNDELLPFDSSSGFETFSFTTQNYIDHDPSCTFLSSRLPQNTTDTTLTTQPDGYFGDFHQNASGEFFAEQVREYTDKNEVDYSSQILSVYEHKSMRGEPIEKMDDGSGDCFIASDNKVLFQQQRVMRRRCLTFEMAGTRRNNLCNDSNSALSSLSHHGQFTSSDGQETTLKPGIGHFTCTMPGIGLHLNALASTPKDIIAHDVRPSAKQPINMPCSISPFPSVPSGQETVNNPLSAEKDNPESNVKNLLLVQDFPQAPVCEKSDDLSHSSPKKKKRRIENGSDGDSCKRCNCKKSKCLKLYCECFAAGVYCVETCSCQGCLNKPQHEETVIQTRKQIESRNPLAFAPKVIRTSEPVSEIGEEANKTPASARHKRGCNCKKSSCLKKYCECYQGGVGCSISCRCEGCKNTFGRKDGTMPGGTEETDPEEAALDNHEKDVEKPDTQQNTYAQNDKQPSFENLPITPSFTSRSCMQLPFHSSGKPPRSSMLTIGSTPKLSTSKEAHVKFEGPSSKKHFQVPTDDETPDILLRSNSSPISGVKVVSPSRKRISPPSNERGVSPSRKGCRKLILKSIPSFPPLTSDSTDELHPSSSPSHLDS